MVVFPGWQTSLEFRTVILWGTQQFCPWDSFYRDESSRFQDVASSSNEYESLGQVLFLCGYVWHLGTEYTFISGCCIIVKWTWKSWPGLLPMWIFRDQAERWWSRGPHISNEGLVAEVASYESKASWEIMMMSVSWGCGHWKSPSTSCTQSLALIEQPQKGLVIYWHDAPFAEGSQLTKY